MNWTTDNTRWECRMSSWRTRTFLNMDAQSRNLISLPKLACHNILKKKRNTSNPSQHLLCFVPSQSYFGMNGSQKDLNDLSLNLFSSFTLRFFLEVITICFILIVLSETNSFPPSLTNPVESLPNATFDKFNYSCKNNCGHFVFSKHALIKLSQVARARIKLFWRPHPACRPFVGHLWLKQYFGGWNSQLS